MFIDQVKTITLTGSVEDIADLVKAIHYFLKECPEGREDESKERLAELVYDLEDYTR